MKLSAYNSNIKLCQKGSRKKHFEYLYTLSTSSLNCQNSTIHSSVLFDQSVEGLHIYYRESHIGTYEILQGVYSGFHYMSVTDRIDEDEAGLIRAIQVEKYIANNIPTCIYPVIQLTIHTYVRASMRGHVCVNICVHAYMYISMHIYVYAYSVNVL